MVLPARLVGDQQERECAAHTGLLRIGDGPQPQSMGGPHGSDCDCSRAGEGAWGAQPLLGLMPLSEPSSSRVE